MWKFVATAKLVLWEFVELAFLALLALVLSVHAARQECRPLRRVGRRECDQVLLDAGSGMLGIVIVLAIIYLAMRRMKPERGARTRAS